MLVDSYHSLCLAEHEASQKLLKYTLEEDDKKTLESEIPELKMGLDLLS